VDATGNLFIADSYNNRIRKVSNTGIITTVAGNGTEGTTGDGGSATSAELYLVDAIAVDGQGNLFIADAYNNRVRRVAPDGIITTVAGTGVAGFSGDGGPATSAQFYGIAGLAADAAGDLFIPDEYNQRIRKVSTSGTISTVAGTGSNGFSGDGGLATAAQWSFPEDVAVDSSGNVYVGDNSTRVRKISASGVITTIAGNGSTGYSGDGGPAASASLFMPVTAGFLSSGLAVSQSGNVYIADTNNLAIRLLTPSNQVVLVSAVVDAASESAGPVSAGKIVTIYGGGLGPQQLALSQPDNGVFGTQLAGTSVAFNGIAAPLVYTSASQVAAIVPYAVSGTSAQMTVSYQGQVSSAFAVTVAASAPGLFTVNETGAGQLATVNAVTGVFNDAAHPAKAGDYLELFATGEGQTTPAGVDGKTAALPYPAPLLAVSVTVGGISAPVVYAGGAPGETAGLMQVNIQIPPGVAPGGYVPVVLTVGAASTINGAVSIAVSAT
jgi:uncharacterized protein (TIGR03437 family)